MDTRMRTRPRLFSGAALAGMVLLAASCSRHDPDRTQTEDKTADPGSATSAAMSTTGASGVAAPYAAVVPADAQPPAAASSGASPSGTSTAGAETSSSPSTGPGNGSTAVGGQAGGQAAGGGSRGGTPARTAGDGR